MKLRWLLLITITIPLLSACSKTFKSASALSEPIENSPETETPDPNPSNPSNPSDPTEIACYEAPAPQTPDLYDCATQAPVTLAEYNLAVSNLNAGAYSANSLSSHFENSDGQVTQNSQWGVTSPKKYIQGNDHTYFSLKSKTCSRDMEVTTYTRNGVVFLRLSPNGNGIFFHLNDEVPNIVIGVMEGAQEGAGFLYEVGTGTFHTLYQKNLTTVIPGYTNSNTENSVFTFGVEGFEIYAKFKSVEFARVRDFTHMEPGRAATQGAGNGYGFRDVAVKHLPKKQYRSDFENNYIDVRDFGWRAAETKGSITNGSSQLSLLSDIGFKVGDSVIVEVGAESGQGLRGTMGVGGTWPPLTYPTFNAMTADTSKTGGTLASVDTTGQIYRAYSGVWHAQDEVSTYYHSKIVPNALVATITAVSNDGKTLTLDKTAKTTVTNANVYFDNTPVINWITERELAGPVPENVIVHIPPGKFALGDRIMLTDRDNWTLEGAGQDLTELWSPKGTPSGQVRVQGTDGVTVKNFHLYGNFGDNGYGMGSGGGYLDGVIFATSSNGVMQDLKVTNVFMRAAGASYSTDVWAYRIQSFLTEPMRMYIQWLLVWADSKGGGCVDCTVESTYLTAGFEAFRSEDISFIRPVGKNATMAMNTSGDFYVEDAHLTFTAMSQFENLNMSFHQNNPVININSNIDASDPLLQKGGIIKNATIIQEGYINNRNDSLPGIVINENNPNVQVIDGYVKVPDWKAPSTQSGAVGLNSTGANTTVDGLRVVGAAKPSGYPGQNIAIETGEIKNCVADLVNANPGTVSNCKTNAQLGGTLPTKLPPPFPDAEPSCPE